MPKHPKVSLLVASLSLVGVHPSIAADYKARPELRAGNQVWDFGRGNNYQFANYHWDFVLSNPMSLKFTCLIGGRPTTNCNSSGGALMAPAGYKICKATILMPSSGIPDPSSFNGALQGNGTRFAWYADFGTSAPQPLSARVSFDVVTVNTPQCMVDREVFICGQPHKAQDCNEYQPGGVQR